LLLLSSFLCTAQTDSSIAPFSLGYLDAVTKKADDISSKLDVKTQKVLAAFQKSEAKLLRKLARKDSTKAAILRKSAEDRYKALERTISSNTFTASYNAALDTLKTSLSFLSAAKDALPAESEEALSKAAASLKGLDKSFASTEAVKAYLKERRQALKESIGKLLPKDLKKLNKQ
jgi:hypothetical protein